jgi:hypothetical protein
MKRSRPYGEEAFLPRRSRRLNPLPRPLPLPPQRFPFLELLPEMRGEVIGWVQVSDRAALARTCKLVHGETPVPQLPLAWNNIREASNTAAQHSSIRDAVLDLMGAGVPSWTTVFCQASTSACCCGSHIHWAWWVPAGEPRYLIWDMGLRCWFIDRGMPLMTEAATWTAPTIANMPQGAFDALRKFVETRNLVKHVNT